MTSDALDKRVQSYLERELGVPLATFPGTGVELRESPARNEEYPLLIIRVGESAVVSGISKVLAVIRPVVEMLDIWELFSPFGVAELRRVLLSENIKVKGGSFHYTLNDAQYCRPSGPTETPIRLFDSDAVPPPEEFDKSFFDGFAVQRAGNRASVAGLPWKSADFVEIAVDTEEEYRGEGYGLAVVTAAVEWILSRGAVAHYPVMPNNVPSVRIARRLGFHVAWQEIYA